MMPVRILITGGTFDKEYDELTGRLFFKDTHVQEMLRLGRCRLGLVVQTVMMVDSLEMTAAGRQQILNACRQAAESRIVVTHGTDTMVETADVLAAGLSGKTVVLTGAMVPYAFGKVLQSGVYIAMNGRCFPAGRVRKNTSLGVFEEASPSGNL